MTETTGALRVVTTERLELRAVSLDDLEPLYAINSDPEAWRHLPQGRHTDIEQTRDWIERAAERWADGLSYWTVRLRGDGDGGGAGPVIGIGGVQAQQGRGHWNLFYRLATAHWGRGYATELSRAGLAAAREHNAELPVFAWIYAHNAGSRAVAERLGLIDHGLRLDPIYRDLLHLYADRPQPAWRDGTPLVTGDQT
ncbi:GNAT family N-acetyltransferase [Kitasatospora sp. NBC_01287]|uniref:GNAT family N-acetyltransferase n=1 Tax=Kitasatospora sp. NBC_01287 TaxID=2903573 RepID=UPI002252752E|nr:GNAT family N-acetyltransferase [Kitasatospora sp. NBC_01287]MCX4747901.1 GNAT family N-acetyltransferase [Kitasatospora sp. NBC_01287]